MPWARPSLTQLIRRIEADVETAIPGLSATLRGTVEHVLARACAGVAHGLYGHLEWLSRQLFPDIADDESLLRWGEIFKTPRKAAVSASGFLLLTGKSNVTLPSAWFFQSAQGALYTTKAEVLLQNGEAVASVLCQTPGQQGNLSEGHTVSMVTPFAGVDSTATVLSPGLHGGLDLESLTEYRRRVLHAIRNPPKGGGRGDYIRWALSMPGVTRAWERGCVPAPGDVTVLFVMDELSPITPSLENIDAMKILLESYAPITASVHVKAPVLKPVDFSIMLPNPSPELHAAIAAELHDVLVRKDYVGQTIHPGELNAAISQAPGWVSHTLLAPSEPIVLQPWELPVLGSFKWS